MPFHVDSDSDEDAAWRRAIVRRGLAGPMPESHPGMEAVRGYMQGLRRRELNDLLSAQSQNSDAPIAKFDNGMTAVRGYMDGIQRRLPVDAPWTVKDEQPGFYSGLGRAAFQGLTFGFGDEIEARLASLVGPESYEEELKRVRGEIDRFQEANPRLAIGAEVAGSLPTLFMPAGAIARGVTLSNRARKALNLGEKTLNAAERAKKAKHGRKVVRGAVIGGATGTVGDIGHGEGNLQERAASSWQGGLLGLASGALTPVASRAITRGLENKGMRLVPVSKKDLGDVPETGDLRENVLTNFERLSVKPESLQALHRNLKDTLSKFSRRQDQSKEILEFIDDIGRMSKGNDVSLKDIVTRVRTDARGVNTNNYELRDALVKDLDSFVANLQLKELVGPIKPGRNRTRRQKRQNYKEGKETFDRLRKAQILDNVEHLAGQGASLSEIKNAYGKLARDRKRMGAFSTQEQNAIKAIARGAFSEKWGDIIRKADGTREAVRALTTVGGKAVLNSAAKPFVRRNLAQTKAMIRTGRALPLDIASLGNDRLLGMTLLGAANARHALPESRPVENLKTRY